VRTQRHRPIATVIVSSVLAIAATGCAGSAANPIAESAVTSANATTTTASPITTTAAPDTTPTTSTTTLASTTTAAAPATTAPAGPEEETITAADTIVSEGDDFADTVVTLNAPAGSMITVNYTAENRTAITGGQFDYISLVGFLTFAPGETSKTIHTQIIDDNLAESLETFQYAFLQSVDATISTPYSQVTIIDNDTIVETPTLFIRDVTVDEKIGSATLAVLLGGPAGQASANTVAVDYTTVDGAATAGNDYTTTGGTLSFAPGDTAQTITVPITDDQIREPAETFTLRLSGATAATIAVGDATVTIGASDGLIAASPLLSGADASVSEPDGFADTVVTLGAPATATVTVQFGEQNATARTGGQFDFIDVGGYLTFAPGETTKVIHTQLVDDLAPEPLETFQVFFPGIKGATIVTPFATVAINDND